MTGGNYACPPHIDEEDVCMNFIIGYLSGETLLVALTLHL